jgi:hypothetical protein
MDDSARNRISTMPLPDPNINGSHCALTGLLDQPLSRSESISSQLAAALSSEFSSPGPIVPLPPGAPDDLPHMILRSRSSEVTFSSVQANFEVRFFDDYRRSFRNTHEYVLTKMRAILAAWESIGAQPVFAEAQLSLQYSMHERPDLPRAATHLVETHLRDPVPSEHLQDARIVLSLHLADRYTLVLNIGTFEARTITRQAAAGTRQSVVRPWEGTVTDSGLQLDIAVNNRYYAVHHREHPRVTVDELDAVVNLVWSFSEHHATGLMETGSIDVAALEGVVA